MNQAVQAEGGEGHQVGRVLEREEVLGSYEVEVPTRVWRRKGYQLNQLQIKTRHM